MAFSFSSGWILSGIIIVLIFAFAALFTPFGLSSIATAFSAFMLIDSSAFNKFPDSVLNVQPCRQW